MLLDLYETCPVGVMPNRIQSRYIALVILLVESDFRRTHFLT